jgi:hypothetical protein
MTAVDVAAAIRAHRYRFSNEDQLQEGLAGALEEAGLHPDREVILSRTDRIDIVVDRVGIEVKVDGRGHDVAKQLERYAAHPDIDELILVTSRARQVKHIRETLNGKPVTVICIAGGGL